MKMIHSILNETQEQRDIELSEITSTSLQDIQEIKMCSPNTIRIYNKQSTPSNSEIINLYSEFKHLNLVGYLRTLMMTSVRRRHRNLIKLLKSTKDGVCLDFGSGVGTHTIAMMENNNTVSMLDVEGPLLQFARLRIERRFNKTGKTFHEYDNLPNNFYDTVVCSDVLEHVPSPVHELHRIHACIKPMGILHLEVSTMVKPSSGHFKKSIDNWKSKGIPFLKEAFKPIEPTIYRKI